MCMWISLLCWPLARTAHTQASLSPSLIIPPAKLYTHLICTLATHTRTHTQGMACWFCSSQIATLIITIFGIGGAIGVIGGGALGQWLYNRRKEWLALLAGSTVLLATGPILYLINADLAR